MAHSATPSSLTDERHPARDDSKAAVPGILAGKRGLVLGVANNRSIAWGIAKAARAHGAELALSYQGDALKKRVAPLAAELDAAVHGRRLRHVAVP